MVVSGVAAFAADVPMLVADDPVGDSLSGSTGLPVGDDLTTATISRPDPLADTVTFSVGVANPPPVLMGVPETLVYNWDFLVTPVGAPGSGADPVRAACAADGAIPAFGRGAVLRPRKMRAGEHIEKLSQGYRPSWSDAGWSRRVGCSTRFDRSLGGWRHQQSEPRHLADGQRRGFDQRRGT